MITWWAGVARDVIAALIGTGVRAAATGVETNAVDPLALGVGTGAGTGAEGATGATG
jgi:hypothetical protein